MLNQLQTERENIFFSKFWNNIFLQNIIKQVTSATSAFFVFIVLISSAISTPLACSKRCLKGLRCCWCSRCLYNVNNFFKIQYCESASGLKHTHTDTHTHTHTHTHKTKQNNDNDNLSLTSAPIIGDSADGENHPRKWGSRDPTTLNHQNNLVC
jgi:hypothetical protein